MIEALYDWAGLTPGDLALEDGKTGFIFRIGFFQIDKKREKSGEGGRDVNGGEDWKENLDDDQLPILNSFYIRDLERAVNCISRGTAGRGLLQYLGAPGDRKPDLYGEHASPFIADRLFPAYTPEGRWPSDPDHNMSLMQQFAVNTAFTELRDEGLLSVNGPPGTGKTTLLRDIIAQNLVERAKVLATLENPGDGLNEDGSLITSLTGFEMVVASMNNAAVENISKELPHAKALATAYETCRYFQPVANQLSAKKKKGLLQPITDPGARAWGIVAAVMGSRMRRNDFITRFFFDDHWEGHPPSRRDPATDFLNFWQFKRLYKGPGFDTAKREFHAAMERFRAVNGTLGEYARLLREVVPSLFRSQLTGAWEEISAHEKLGLAIEKRLAEAMEKKDELDAMLCAEHIGLKRIRLERPGFFVRLFNLSGNKAYQKALSQQLEIIETLTRRINALEKEIRSMQRGLATHQCERAKLAGRMDEIKSNQARQQARLDELAARFKGYGVTTGEADITDARVQQDAFWQARQINDLRTRVFMAAMQLHEAWLMEAMKNSAFHHRIFGIKDTVYGKRDSAGVLELWQILFMFVPVVSTTFASLGRMFAHLGENSLGWLMIDEAGQAVPQAAVGGLMRARRTVVVGDPLQIEPVFTCPPGLVRHLMSPFLGDRQKEWNPNFKSVQQLADRVNPYGCELMVMEKQMWIGIPLWVHRRCMEPMFSIANEIAYGNRMIQGNTSHPDRPGQDRDGAGGNQWVESTGRCIIRQYKQELGADVLDVLLTAVNAGDAIQDIYIITPFKAVKKELKAFLSRNRNKDMLVKAFGSDKKGISGFIKSNIGTIHTFQGKENHTVILVLGCDRERQGGAFWAASRPNLLNVAVTRAKKRIIVVGDTEVWADKPYFSLLYQCLSTDKSEAQATG
ncbi:MAG: ATP-binding protein [Desulfobacter sp.]